MNNDVLARNELYAFDENKPFASYMKTILAQVGITVWDRFTNQPTETILKGDPRRKEEGCIVDVWSPKEDAFFRRQNARHFRNGILIPYKRPEDVVEEVPVEQYSDEQLRDLINLKFAALNKRLNDITSEAVLFRMRSLADEMEKSEKIIAAIEKRISDVQLVDYQPKNEAAPQEE